MSNENTNKLERFLLEEYSNIAQAHFKSIETISVFFRYYLLIMSLPISVIAVISRIKLDEIVALAQQYKYPIGATLFCISLIGLGVLVYIINLRLDVILYARTVNGIRKYFYDNAELDINLKLRMRILPQSPQLPQYTEEGYFLPVVFVFGFLNTFYSALGCYIFQDLSFLNPWYLDITILIFISHFVLYAWRTYRMETIYLKSNILGVDIDGVLNKHREHFCPLLKEKTGKIILPDNIVTLPVHDDLNSGVIREDERKVFNMPEYWTDMPVIENVAGTIRKLRNTFKLKIHIFTYRPWPDNPNKKELIGDIKNFLKKCRRCSLIPLRITLFVKFMNKLSILLKEQPLKHLSKKWLKNHNFKYDKFIFEKGNDYSSDPRGEFKNRFYVARMKKIRFFVEDDIEKAIKLSYICDIVFLLSHPYNKPNDNLPKEINKIRENLPSNIIRVKNWDEVYQHIRRLS